jgi:D-beta-D-heptose 7-phosphate kinase / D-beta-D-heptose 1-phosphate adenosyltransferase
MLRQTLTLPSATPRRVLVVGEVVLDRYRWGTVERISPEAPIPVLHLDRSEERLGNAAFVAASINALGGKAHLLSVIGTDADGYALRHLAEQQGIGCESLIEQSGHPTIVKERLLGAAQSASRGVQQILRVDREDSSPLDEETEAKLVARLTKEIQLADSVLVCDINKGLLSGRVLAELIHVARRQNKRIIIDPRRSEDFSIYHGASVLTPNRFETQYATGIDLAEPSNWPAAARKLVDDLDLNAALITLDRDGMFLSEQDGSSVHIRTTSREVYDVTGAGDVVLAVFGFFWTAGLSAAEAAELANVAASLEVTRRGTTLVSRDELSAALRDENHRSAQKIVPLQVLRDRVRHERDEGRRICFIDWEFNSLDARQVRLLEFARNQADLLVVGVRNEENASASNSLALPETDCHDRIRVLAALEAVNYVVADTNATAVDIVGCSSARSVLYCK